MDIEIFKQTDKDGYSSFECDLCQESFKLLSGEVQEDDVLELFCPKCGIPQPFSQLYPQDIIQEAEEQAVSEINRQINQMFKGLEKKSKRNHAIKFKAGKPLPVKPKTDLYEKEEMDYYRLSCCERDAKFRIITISNNPFCPYCGVN